MTSDKPVAHEQGPVFPVLDTLRAIGALAVVSTHVAFWSGDYLGNGVWGTLLSRMDAGVALFFVLSGFLLARPYLARAQARRAAPPVGRYYVKRLLRIYPVYVVTVVLAMLLIDDNSSAGVGGWVRALLMVDVYTSPQLPHGLTQMWSLAVEVSFYVVLPALVLLMVGRTGPLRTRRVLAVLGVLGALSAVWHVGLADRVASVSSGVPLTWLPGYLSWFAVGIALALAHVVAQGADQASTEPPAAVRFLRTLGSMPGACWTLVAGLLLVAATPLAGPSLLFVATPAESLVKHVLYAAIGGLVVLTGVFASPGYERAMSTRVSRHLGHISYGVFCIHLPLITAIVAVTGFEVFAGGFLELWVLTVVTSLVAAELLHRLVELPAMRLLRPRRQDREGSVATTQPQSATTSS